MIAATQRPAVRGWDVWATGLLLFCLAGLFVTPYPPDAQAFRESALAGPSWQHWLGVDGLGRDFASRLWRGAGHTVALAAAALLLTLALAALLLAAEQALPRWVGAAVRQFIRIWVAWPVLFVGLLLLIFLRPSPQALVLAVGLGNLALCFRQLRVYWLQLLAAPFVQASIVIGTSRWQRFRWVLWPNLLPDLAALGRLLFALSALELSGLAFLGLIGNPDFPELGSILKQNQAYLYHAPALLIWPGLLLSGILFSVHLARFHR